MRLTRNGSQIHGVVEGGDVAGPRRSTGQLLQDHSGQVINERRICVESRHAAPVLQHTQGSALSH